MISTSLSDRREIGYGDGEVGAEGLGTRITGRDKKLLTKRTPLHLPGQGMFPSAGTEYQYIHNNTLKERAKDTLK
jgi:hypothetical protein